MTRNKCKKNRCGVVSAVLHFGIEILDKETNPINPQVITGKLEQALSGDTSLKFLDTSLES